MKKCWPDGGHVGLVGRKDLTGEIYRQLRRAILDGRLPPGGPPRHPHTREDESFYRS